ncbi:hypothetical protein BH09SUM1_BH09SUM1_15320 [soil metagenome]
MAKENPSIARSAAIDSGAQIAVMAFSFAAGIYLARKLGDTGRGRYVFATTFAGQLVFSMVNLGMELAASVSVAKDRSRLSEVHTLIVVTCSLLLLVLTLLTWACFDEIRFVFLPGIERYSVLALTLAMPFWVYQSSVYGMLVGLNAIRARAIFDLVFNLVQNLLVVLILASMSGEVEDEVVRMLILSFYFTIIGSCFCLWAMMVFRGVRWRGPKWDLIAEFYRYGFWVYIGNMGNGFGQRIDQYFLKQLTTGAGAFGKYNLATSLTNRMRVFPQALSRSVYPRLASATEKEAAELTAASFRQMFVMSLLLCVIGTITSPLIPIVYTKEFAAAVFPFIIFLFGKLFSHCSWMLSNYFSGYLARPQIPMVINWAVLPLQGAAAWFALTQIGGLTALAAMTSVAYFLVFLMFLIVFLRMQKHVGMRDLFIPRAGDLDPWKRFIGKRWSGPRASKT